MSAWGHSVDAFVTAYRRRQTPSPNLWSHLEDRNPAILLNVFGVASEVHHSRLNPHVSEQDRRVLPDDLALLPHCVVDYECRVFEGTQSVNRTNCMCYTPSAQGRASELWHSAPRHGGFIAHGTLTTYEGWNTGSADCSFTIGEAPSSTPSCRAVASRHPVEPFLRHQQVTHLLCLLPPAHTQSLDEAIDRNRLLPLNSQPLVAAGGGIPLFAASA